MLKLMDSDPYWERELQQGIEEFWRWVFPCYPLLIDRTALRIRHWRPDVVAFNGADLSRCLLIELKGRPPDKPLKAAIGQVVHYAKRLQGEYPETEILPIVLGPYKTGKQIERYQCAGFVVLVIHVSVVCKFLAGIAESLLRERPSPCEGMGFTEWLDMFA